MLTRRKISKLAAQLDDVNENPGIEQEYRTALRTLDYDKLDTFLKFGDTVRHQVINLHTYRSALRFGYTTIALDKNNWLERAPWEETEKIEIKASGDKETRQNNIRLAKGLNGSWTYALYCNFGGSSFSYAPSVFGKVFSDRTEALIAAIEDKLDRFTHAIAQNRQFPDKSNFNEPYMLSVTNELVALKQKTLFSQMSLF